MKIESVDVGFYNVPLPVVLSDSTHGDISSFELITVRVTSENGQEGVGYTYTPGTGGAGVYALIDKYLAKHIVGKDCFSVESLWEEMWWHLHYIGRGGAVSFAISAVDIALWDLKARCLNLPLWKLLGGSSNEVKAYAGGIDLQFSLDELKKQTEGFLDQGFRAIKMKVGRQLLSDDVSRVASIRNMLGNDFPLLVDANMGWTVDEAIVASKALSGYGVFWLEEPTIPDDVEGHARIASEGGIPIATGENFHSIYDFLRFMKAEAVSFPEPDVCTVGGITVWMKVAALAGAHNLPVTSHGVHDITVGLLAAVPNASYLEVHGFNLDPYIDKPLELRNGFAIASDRVGHGVNMDWEALERYRATF